MGKIRSFMGLAALVTAPLWLVGPVLGHQDEHATGQGESAPAQARASEAKPAKVTLLDRALLDQDGRPLRFASEAVADRIVVMDFIYTSCTTTCPVQSQIMAQVQDGLGAELGREVRLLSLSVDPATDTPRRLKRHAGRFGAGPGWFWLTGPKPEVDRVLNGLGVYTPDFSEHPGVVLVGDGRTGAWTRLYGPPGPDRILAKVKELAAARQTTKPAPTGEQAAKALALENEARRYFTDLPVVSHDGRALRFFTDLLREKIVVVTLFYTDCAEACPIINSRLANLQEILGDRLGREVFFLSITLDPETDTPEVLKSYAANYVRRDGWSFVTGEPKNVRTITRRLGHATDEIAAHSTFLMVGDVKKAYWKKFPPNVSIELLRLFLDQLAAGE